FWTDRWTPAVRPNMRGEVAGRIINIGSVLGFLPAPYMALYAATKHAIEGYSESLDHELRTRGIRVCIIEPAYTKTQFDANLLEADAKLDEYREVRAAMSKRLTQVLAAADEPGIVAGVVQAAIGLVETYFIGKLGTDALAGVALVFPLVMLMQMMSAGAMGGGIASSIARALGGGRRADADALALHALVIALGFGLAFTLA